MKKDPRDFLPWAGWFIRPDTEAEGFRSLPGWRQRQINLLVLAAKEGRNVTLEEYRRAGAQEAAAPAVLSLPDGWELATLQRLDRLPTPEPSFLEAATPVLQSMLAPEKLTEGCTVFGEGRQLRTRCPSDGLHAYAWMSLAQKKGLRPTLPVSAIVELQEGLYQHTGRACNLRGSDPVAVQVRELADKLVSAFVNTLS